MTSTLKGWEEGWLKRDDSTDKLREWDIDKGGGGPKIRKICGRHLSIAPKMDCYYELGGQFRYHPSDAYNTD